ncbi:MAG: DUF2029 domain-containing protein [Cyclobacteriaceae bacterium]|nr:DUF2029 domain-containing protein [Cyclobacteriaceae bacterium HetDA_MAG_MS6]
MPNQGKATLYTLAFLYLSSLSFLANMVVRNNTMILFLTFFCAGFSYFWLCRHYAERQKLLASIGLLARLSLLSSLPNLSDDFYRFLWDGLLINYGLDPYAQLPSHLDLSLFPMLPDILDKMNSPDYYTIYPPLNQLIFWISTWADSSELMSINVMRILLILADLGAYLVLRGILLFRKRAASLSFWYLLNPLVVLEFTGNLHFEGLLIFFLLLAIYFLARHRIYIAGFFMGLAIATKLIPLIFLPAILMQYKWKKGILFCTIALLTATTTFLPMINSAITNGMLSSLGLYFQKFEFNASIYFLVREVGYWIKGYNAIQTIGPALGILTLLSICGWSIYSSSRNHLTAFPLLISLCLYLAFATTVHPWYVLTLIPLGILSGYYFPVVWSLAIFLTYAGYATPEFHLPPYLVAIEYGCVLVFSIFEFRKYDATD